MQRFWWPGYQMHLLGELQRQQNNAQFCDTLLKTDGISVPTHSCILAALSPYLSQKLSDSPSPPSGQKREVQLRAVNAQTLLKLVGLLYSGEMEVNGGVERNDVLSAVRQFGILDLVERPKNGGYSGSCQEKLSESRKTQDAQVQTGMPGRRDDRSGVKKRSCGTETVEECEKTVDSQHPIPQPTSSVAQSLDVSTATNSQNNMSNHISSACVTNFTESELDLSSDSGGNPMSSNMMPSPFHLNSTTPQEDSRHLLPVIRDSVQALAEEGMGSKDGTANGETEQQRDGDLENSIEKSHACEDVEIQSLDVRNNAQNMMETAQFSMKVKLRRRNKGETWEIVSLKDRNETLSVLTSLTQGGSIHRRTQVDLTVQPPLPSVQPENLILQPATPSLEPPTHSNTSSSQLSSADCLTPNNSLESLAQPPAEDYDEQIEKFLEDIMMGLNILPNIERDCKTPQYFPGNNDQAPDVSQAPFPEDEPHVAVSGAGGTNHQDFGTRSSVKAAQNQPSCSSVRPAAPVAPSTLSAIPTALWSSGPKQPTGLKYYPEFQALSSQESRTLTKGNETQSWRSLHCMKDFQLLQCVSPLAPPPPSAASFSLHLPPLNNPVNWCSKIQPQRRRPWLTGKPASQKFPLSAVVHRANERTSLPWDANHSCWSKQQRNPLELSSQGVGTWAASCPVKKDEEKAAVVTGHRSKVAEVKSASRKRMNKQGVTEGDAATPRKRKCAGHPQEAASLLTCKRVKVSDGAKDVLSLSACSVRLSNNNLLAKEREMASSSSNTALKRIRKLSEPLTVTEEIPSRGDLNAEKILTRRKGRRASTVNAGRVPKNGRGRPRKKTAKESSSQSSAAVTDKKTDSGKRDVPNDNLRTKRRRRKQLGNAKEERAAPLTINAETSNNSDVMLTEAKLGAVKRPRMVTLKEFQKLIQCQHSKIKSKVGHDKETASAVGGDDDPTCEELTKRLERDVERPQSRDETKESSVHLNVSVDENHNQVFIKPAVEFLDETNNSTSKDTSFFGDESHPVSFCDVLGKDGTKIPGERELPLKTPDAAQDVCDAGMSVPTPQTVGSDTSSASVVHPPQDNTINVDDSLNPQSPDRTSPPLSMDVSCDHEDEEEVEVDVVLFSPGKVPQTGECENGLNMEILPEEEEEEDIDVTGDEAE